VARSSSRSCRRPGHRERVLLRSREVDDPVGAISVHGVNGVWACSRSVCSPTVRMPGWNGVGATTTSDHRRRAQRRHRPVLWRSRADRRPGARVRRRGDLERGRRRLLFWGLASCSARTACRRGRDAGLDVPEMGVPAIRSSRRHGGVRHPASESLPPRRRSPARLVRTDRLIDPPRSALDRTSIGTRSEPRLSSPRHRSVLVYLLVIAALPLFLARFWDSNRTS